MKPGILTRLRLKNRLLPILVIAALAMQLIEPYKVWMISLLALGGLWLWCYYWARSLARRLRLYREMRFGWAQVGDQLEERFTLQNDHWLPALWVEIQDDSNLPGYNASRGTGVDPLSYNSWQTHGTCTRRGVFTLGPTRLVTGDPFGIYEVEITDPSKAALTVMPPIVPLPSIEVAPGGRSGAGRPRSRALERTVNASSVRGYAPGDSLHLIHWRTTARHDSPYVRIFDGAPVGDWWIFLDLETGVQAGEGWDSTVEHSIILAASLADRGLRLKRPVGLVANGRELIWLPPQEGMAGARRWEILRALALAETGDISLGQLLERTRSSIGKQASLIFITPSTEPGWIEALLPILWRGAEATVLLLDRATFGSDGDSRPVASQLWKMGIANHLIPRQLLDRPEARPGQAGGWEWRITPRGRAVAVRKPADLNWKALG
jgi:uncharacterized protein (DUF58 family)